MRHPTLEECEAAGRGPGISEDGRFKEGGLPDTAEERQRFEAYMRGHAWYCEPYDKTIRGYQQVLTRMLYGIWRDRGALPTLPTAEYYTPQQMAEMTLACKNVDKDEKGHFALLEGYVTDEKGTTRFLGSVGRGKTAWDAVLSAHRLQNTKWSYTGK